MITQSRVAMLFMANGWSLDLSKSVEDECHTLTKGEWTLTIQPEATFWWKGDDDWPFAERKNLDILSVMEELTEV